jgi:hypothetical protein
MGGHRVEVDVRRMKIRRKELHAFMPSPREMPLSAAVVLDSWMA